MIISATASRKKEFVGSCCAVRQIHRMTDMGIGLTRPSLVEGQSFSMQLAFFGCKNQYRQQSCAGYLLYPRRGASVQHSAGNLQTFEPWLDLSWLQVLRYEL